MEIDTGSARGAGAPEEPPGFLLIVVTNQPDVARGNARREDVEAMHAVLRAALPLDDCCVCYHDDARWLHLPQAAARPADPGGGRARHRSRRAAS